MALAPLKQCTSPGCRALVRGAARCPLHTKRTENRPSSTQRGYDRNWAKVRAIKLANDPLCQDCLEQGRTTAASEAALTLCLVPLTADSEGRVTTANMTFVSRNGTWQGRKDGGAASRWPNQNA
jgi:hypothetical protein